MLELNESQMNVVNETYESFDHKGMSKEDLQEWFEGKDLGQVQAIDESHSDVATKMALLQEKYINETNVSANIEPFRAQLQPLLRRIMPKFIHIA